MICTECNGSGACDLCDGYGCFPESSPNAGDGPECDTCAGSGSCRGCGGIGESTTSNVRNDDTSEMSA